MNPSSAAVSAVRDRVSDWTPGDAEIAAELNAPDRPNPSPRATTPTPFTVSGVLGLLVVSLGNLKDVAFAARVRDDIAANDVAAVLGWGQVLLAGAVITQDEHDGIAGMITRTEPDPSWPAQISWAVATLGRPVDAADVAASRPGVN